MRSRTSFKGETSRVSAFAISAGIVLALFAPQFAPAQEISTGSAVSQGSLSVTQEALKAALLSRGSGDRDGAKSTPNAVEAFYAARDYWPVWSGTRDANRAAGAARYLDDRGLAVLAELDAIAAAHETTVAAVALAWLAAQPTVTSPIASARTPEQLADLLPMASLELTEEEVARLSAVSA